MVCVFEMKVIENGRGFRTESASKKGNLVVCCFSL